MNDKQPQQKPLTRQQQRELARKAAKDTGKLIELVDRALTGLHGRIEVLTEALRLTGVTEETLKQAEANVLARGKKEAG